MTVLLTKSSLLRSDNPEPPLNAAVSAAETSERDALIRQERFTHYLIVLTVFWAFIAGTNVLYGNTMQASMAMMGVKHVLTPWHARLLQHVILYPALVAFVWIAFRMDWRPLGLALAAQTLCSSILPAGDARSGGRGSVGRSAGVVPTGYAADRALA